MGFENLEFLITGLHIFNEIIEKASSFHSLNLEFRPFWSAESESRSIPIFYSINRHSNGESIWKVMLRINILKVSHMLDFFLLILHKSSINKKRLFFTTPPLDFKPPYCMPYLGLGPILILSQQKKVGSLGWSDVVWHGRWIFLKNDVLIIFRLEIKISYNIHDRFKRK